MELLDDDIDRKKMYELFSSLFINEPAEELLLQMRDIFGIKLKNTLNDIRTDFNRLFLESARNLPPYESLYNYPLWEKPKLPGRVTEEVQKLYHSAGITIYEDIDLFPDHLSAELLFMSYLIERGLIDLQKSFLKDHLSVWIPGYCDEIQLRAQTPFYQHVAALLKEFILEECEDFGIRSEE